MTQTDSKKLTVLDAFLKQREKRQNDTGIQAQKLVNLYRHLALFGDDFLVTYNKMLLETPADVQLALSDVIGGMVVRQYLEFLRTKQQKPDQEIEVEEKPTYATEVSYLPAADDVAPFMSIGGASGGANQSIGIDEAVVKSQGAFFEKALSKQTEFLGKALTQMQESLAEQLAVVQSKSPSPLEKGPDMNKALEQILTKQNQVFVDSLKQVFENSAEITAKQMETFEKVLKNNLSQGSVSYPEIEEYVPMPQKEPPTAYIVSGKNAQPVPPRAYHPSKEQAEVSMLSVTTEPQTIQEVPRTTKKTTPPMEEIEILSESDLTSEPL